MATNWNETSFGDICRHSAFGPRFSSKEYAENGNIACLRTKDISRDGRIDFPGMPLADLNENSFASHYLQQNDLVITRTGRVGTTAVFTSFGKPVVPGAFLIRFRLDEDQACPWFFRYYFNSPVGQGLIQTVATGSVQQNLNITNLHKLVLPLPPLRDQKAIASFLGTLDDKIELNRRMNETLESMARALFKSWFVDFDPVIDNALAAGHSIPEPLAARAESRRALGEARKPLPENIRSLFPATFAFDEEMGWIPKGWEVDSIKNRSSSVQYGFTQSSTEEQVGPHFLRITDIRGGQVSWQSVPFCVASADVIDKYRIVDGDVLVARTGASTGENTYIVSPPEAVFASYLVRFQFASQGVGRYVGQFMRTAAFANYVASTIGGSAQPNASAQTLGSARSAFPSTETAEAFYEHLRSSDLKRAHNEMGSHSLARLRDTLLPKLLSGELRIPEAEKLVADCV